MCSLSSLLQRLGALHQDGVRVGTRHRLRHVLGVIPAHQLEFQTTHHVSPPWTLLMAAFAPFGCHPGSELTLIHSPPTTSTLSPQQWQPSLYVELVSSYRCWIGYWAWTGSCAGMVTVTWPALQAVPYISSSLFLGVSNYACDLHKWNLGFLQPSCKFYWFLNQLRVLIFPVSDSRTRVPNTWFELLILQGGYLSLCNPPV